MQPQLPHKTIPSKVLSLFGSRQVHFHGTSKPITQFGDLISLVEFFGKLRPIDAIQEFMPFKLNSPSPFGWIPTLQQTAEAVLTAACQIKKGQIQRGSIGV